MAHAARNPWVANITNQTSRLAPPRSQKSTNRVVSARGRSEMVSTMGRTARPRSGVPGTVTVEVTVDVTPTLYGIRRAIEPEGPLRLLVGNDAAGAGIRPAARGRCAAIGVFRLHHEASLSHPIEVVPRALVVGLVSLIVIPRVQLRVGDRFPDLVTRDDRDHVRDRQIRQLAGVAIEVREHGIPNVQPAIVEVS